MTDSVIKKIITWPMILYFGWLLSFPFYGPVFFKVAPFENYNGFSLVTVFIFCHALTYLVAGFGLKDKSHWYQIMLGSVIVTIVANSLLLIPSGWLWMSGMAVMGSSSAFFVLGWSVIYSLSGQITKQIKIMSLIIIGANLLLMVYTSLATVFSSTIMLLLTNIPLIIVGVILLKVSKDFRNKVLKPFVQMPVSKPLMLILALFIFTIYLNGGFMYRVMLPALRVNDLFGTYYPFAIYILVLIIINRLNRLVKSALLIYLGVSFLGLAFTAYALLGGLHSGYLMTIGLMESSFAFIDIFLWITLSSLALVYGAPYKIFGIILAANSSSILFGDFIGMQLLNSGENIYLIMALLSTSSILLAIIVIPWLVRFTEQKFALVMKSEKDDKDSLDDSPYGVLMEYILPNQKLTQREIGVVKLVLQGMTNKDIAQELFISEHTVKTHLKNIYRKFGATRKKELMHLATRKERNSL